MINNINKQVDDMSLVVMVSEVNMIDSNLKEWWFNIGATRHVCTNRDLFSTFQPVQEKNIYMCNSASTAVEG